jgi:hypothetical protein
VLESHYFRCLQYLEMFIPLKQTLFLEIARIYLEPNQGNVVSVPFQHFIFAPETI